MNDDLRENLWAIQKRIDEAARRAGRNPEDVKLIAVSKTHPSDVLRRAIASGALILGENKIQEAEGKIAEIGRETIKWHLIGHLQSNKARKAVKLFDCVQTLDSLELAERLERICLEENVNLSILIQVDLGKEATKNGVDEQDLPPLVEFLNACKHLKFDGLMTIPPAFEDAERARPFFKRLRELRDEFLPNGGELSMGMSNDFETAIEEGATYVRVGTAIFGER